jgi:hypothetical protein
MTTLESKTIVTATSELEQGNILDVLHAHKVLGSSEWLFHSDARTDLEELHEMGLVYFIAGPVAGSFMASLTDLGVNMMSASYNR